jgi:hypothetical protein
VRPKADPRSDKTKQKPKVIGERHIMSGSVFDIIDTLSADERKAYVEWINGVLAEYRHDIMQGSEGIVEMDAASVREFVRSAISFWSAKKPELPPVSTKIPAAIIAKTYYCDRQIKSVMARIPDGLEEPTDEAKGESHPT